MPADPAGSGRPSGSLVAAHSFDLTDQLAAIESQAARMGERLRTAGLAAPVPTCPEWTMHELITHVGSVHRWAAYIVSNAITDFADIHGDFSPQLVDPTAETMADWLIAGAAALARTLAAASADLRALVFLKSAPPPRQFWARRATHETTIHAVDALAAQLGRFPTTKEAGIPADLALNGLQELLQGFLPRKSSAMRTYSPLTFLVAPTDSEHRWKVLLSAEPPVVMSGADQDGSADAVMTGSAASLYLGLWNRGDEIAVSGEPELLGVWRDKLRIRWN